MQLTFVHDCLPQAEGQKGCPIAGREVQFSTDNTTHLNEYVRPDVFCVHTNFPLKVVAVDGNRDI